MRLSSSSLPLLPLMLAATSPALSQQPECTLGVGDSRFVMSDHTTVVRTIMQNLLPVLAQLDLRNYVFEEREPTPTEVLEAILTLQTVGEDTKRRVRSILPCLPQLGRELSPEHRRASEEILTRLTDAESVPAMVEQLATMLAEGEYGDDQAIIVAITTTMLILQDGVSTIYSEEHTFYAVFRRPTETTQRVRSALTDHIKDVGIADAEGAFSGALAGCYVGTLAGGAGCVPAALAGGIAAGIGSSGVTVLTKLLRRLFRR